jgi:hypothetical protein
MQSPESNGMPDTGFITAWTANKAGMRTVKGTSNSRSGTRKERTGSYASRAISNATREKKLGQKQPWCTLTSKQPNGTSKPHLKNAKIQPGTNRPEAQHLEEKQQWIAAQKEGEELHQMNQ